MVRGTLTDISLNHANYHQRGTDTKRVLVNKVAWVYPSYSAGYDSGSGCAETVLSSGGCCSS